jgi:hypothetical protein
MGPKGRAALIVISAFALAGSAFYVGWFRHAIADSELSSLLSEEESQTYVGVQQVTSFGPGPEHESKVEVHRKASKERLDYLTGPATGMVLIDDGEHLWRLDPERKIAGEFPSEKRPVQSDLFWENYRARVHPGAEVAGHRCKGLRIEPHGHIGPTRILWYEPPAGAGRILKREDYNTSGRLASRSEFTEIDFRKKVAESVFDVPSDYEVRMGPPEPEPVALDDAEATVGFAPLVPSYVPDGYELDRTVAVTSPRGHQTLVLEYFDGLNRVGVFERIRGQRGEDERGPGFGPNPEMGREPDGGPPHGPGPGPGFGEGGPDKDGDGRGRGPGGPKGHGPGWLENRMAGAATNQVGDVRVVVIGDLPPHELQKIADSVE